MRSLGAFSPVTVLLKTPTFAEQPPTTPPPDTA